MANRHSNSSYLVCAEPQTGKTFVLHFGSETAIEVKILKKEVMDGIQNKTRRSEFKID
jgi:hypothetical protein